MRQVRLMSLLIVMLASLVVVPAASAKPGASPKSDSSSIENAELVTPFCADGCPPGPRPTMY